MSAFQQWTEQSGSNGTGRTDVYGDNILSHTLCMSSFPSACPWYTIVGGV